MSNGILGFILRIFGLQRRAHSAIGFTVEQYAVSAGYRSAEEYAASHPTAGIAVLARRLKIPRHQQWMLHLHLLAEAERAGTVERYARSLFVRWIHNTSTISRWTAHNEIVPMVGFGSPFEQAIVGLLMSLPEQYRSACHRVAIGYDSCYASRIRTEWMPKNANDPTLIEIFSYWPKGSVSVQSKRTAARP